MFHRDKKPSAKRVPNAVQAYMGTKSGIVKARFAANRHLARVWMRQFNSSYQLFLRRGS
jgi:hypothetical protein